MIKCVLVMLRIWVLLIKIDIIFKKSLYTLNSDVFRIPLGRRMVKRETTQ